MPVLPHCCLLTLHCFIWISLTSHCTLTHLHTHTSIALVSGSEFSYSHTLRTASHKQAHIHISYVCEQPFIFVYYCSDDACVPKSSRPPYAMLIKSYLWRTFIADGQVKGILGSMLCGMSLSYTIKTLSSITKKGNYRNTLTKEVWGSSQGFKSRNVKHVVLKKKKSMLLIRDYIIFYFPKVL